MGNFMIGDFYPPYLGWVDKIMCGDEQCWPVNKDVLHVIVKDNPVDKNVIKVFSYAKEDLYVFAEWQSTFYNDLSTTGGPLMVTAATDGYPDKEVQFLQRLEKDYYSRTFLVTKRMLHYDETLSTWTLNDYSDIVIYRDYPYQQAFHITIYRDTRNTGEYEVITEYDTTGTALREDNVKYNKTTYTYLCDTSEYIVLNASYEYAVLQRIDVKPRYKAAVSLTNQTISVPYGYVSDEVCYVDLYYGPEKGSWTIQLQDDVDYKVLKSTKMDPDVIWNDFFNGSLREQHFYYGDLEYCSVQYSEGEMSGKPLVIASIRRWSSSSWLNDYEVWVENYNGVKIFNIRHITYCYKNAYN